MDRSAAADSGKLICARPIENIDCRRTFSLHDMRAQYNLLLAAHCAPAREGNFHESESQRVHQIVDGGNFAHRLECIGGACDA